MQFELKEMIKNIQINQLNQIMQNQVVIKKRFQRFIDFFMKLNRNRFNYPIINPSSINFIFFLKTTLMINLTLETKDKVADELKQLFPTLSKIIRLPEKFNSVFSLIRLIKSHLRNSINFQLDPIFQNQTYDVLKKVDSILNTQQADKLKKKAQNSFILLPQIIKAVMSSYIELEATLPSQDHKLIISQSKQSKQSKQKNVYKEVMMDSAFADNIPLWTFSEFNQILTKNWELFKPISFLLKDQFQKQFQSAFKDYQDFIKDLELNVEYLDAKIKKRIDSNKSSFYVLAEQTAAFSPPSLIRKISEDSKNSSNFLSEQQTSFGQVDILDFNKLTLDSGVKQKTYTKIIHYNQNSCHIFSKTKKIENPKIQRKIYTKVEQNSMEKELKTQLSTQCQTQITQPFIVSNNRQIQEANIGQSYFRKHKMLFNFQEPNYRSTLNTQIEYNFYEMTRLRMDQNQYETEIVIPQVVLNDQQKNQIKLKFSNEMIRRYLCQSRFTKDQQENVNKIIREQYEPLKQFLQSLPAYEVDNQSPGMSEPNQQVQMYGSFRNSCGFRKICDLNINIKFKNRLSRLPASPSHLKTKLDEQRSKKLKLLNLRSIIYSKPPYKEVILSHENNKPYPQDKIKVDDIVNFIYITIDKREYTQSSRFMNESIYNRSQKTQKICHLINFLHLIFKRNNILVKKDTIRYFFGTVKISQFKNCEEYQKIRQHQNWCCSLTIHALHLMVLFYLIDSGQITKFKFDPTLKRYDFEWKRKDKTLYEQYDGFLVFYSQNGGYSKKYQGRNFIDIIERDKEQYISMNKRATNQYGKKSLETNKFVLVHPMAKYMINDPCGIFQKVMIKGSLQERLFYRKIDELLKGNQKAIIQNYSKSNEWSIQHLFSSKNESFYWKK